MDLLVNTDSTLSSVRVTSPSGLEGRRPRTEWGGVPVEATPKHFCRRLLSVIKESKVLWFLQSRHWVRRPVRPFRWRGADPSQNNNYKDDNKTRPKEKTSLLVLECKS